LFQGSALKQYSGRTGERDNALIDQLKQGAIADLGRGVNVNVTHLN